MKLVTFLLKEDLNTLRIGALKDNGVIDFSFSDLPNNMIDFIALGNRGLDKANDLIQVENNIYFNDDIILKAPILKPNKILAIGIPSFCWQPW